MTNPNTDKPFAILMAITFVLLGLNAGSSLFLLAESISLERPPKSEVVCD